MRLFSLIIFFAVFISCTRENSNISKDFSLIPLPNSIEFKQSFFLLTSKSKIHFSRQSKEFSKLPLQLLERKGIRFKQGGIDADLKIKVDDDLKKEAYILEVKKEGIKIFAADYSGFLYGLQSLSQIIDQAKKTSEGILIPCLKIEDEPEFKWRGMHLDVCRHFFDVKTIKKMLDAMAMHKLNTFHWHLSDDQGWRIEIDKYPLLTEISAWRSESVVGHMAKIPVQFDGKKHGGFYTKQEIKNVVDYASKLGITVVPEIEMPGHAVAALMAYPELCCTGKPKAFNEWGVSSDVYCAGNESAFEFLENVLAEVIDLFPGEFIHIGGDECPKDRWKECPKCQHRVEKEGLKDEHELQSYFIQRIEKFVNSKGKKIIGWDEILEGGLAQNAALMSWRGEEGGIEAANLNHYVVMTPNPVCYLDHYQNNRYEPLAIGGLTTMEKIYNWSPIPEGLATNKQHFILGAQGNVWTEYITTHEHLEYMVYPRLCAMAEMLWTKKENQKYKDFEKRMNFHYNRLDAKGIKYRIPYPNIEPYNPILKSRTKIILENGISSSEIYYTLDGAVPNEKSNLYNEPFTLDLAKPVKLKAVSIMPSGRKSIIAKGIYELCDLQPSVKIENLTNGLTFTKFNQLFSSAFDVVGKADTTLILDDLELPYSQLQSSYGAIFSGYIEVPKDGIYTFYLHVKDGGLLYINYNLVVNNDGFKYGTEKNGKIALEKGKHLFRIKYFMGKGWSELDLSYQLDDGEIMPVLPEQYYTISNQ